MQNVTFFGKRWRVEWVEGLPELGYCEKADKVDKRVLLDSRLRGQKLVEVLVHECTHAAFWHLDEEFVREFADEIAKALFHKDMAPYFLKELTAAAAPKLGAKNGQETKHPVSEARGSTGSSRQGEVVVREAPEGLPD
jgi:hypothetical protein